MSPSDQLIPWVVELWRGDELVKRVYVDNAKDEDAAIERVLIRLIMDRSPLLPPEITFVARRR